MTAFRVRFPLQLLPAVFITVLAAGCADTKAVFLVDPYIGFGIGSDAEPGERVTSIAGELGVQIRLHEIQVAGDVADAVRAAVGGSREKVVILGPLFLKQSLELAAEFPDKSFIVAGAYQSPGVSEMAGEAPANLVICAFERESVFSEAGKLYAREIGSVRERYPDSVISAAAVFYTGTFSRRNEMNAFLSGYRSGGEPVPLTAETVSNLDRMEEIASIVERIPDGDIQFRFLSAASLNAHALELLMSRSVNLAGENIGSLAASGETVLFSIQDDITAAVKKGLEAFAAGAHGMVTAESTLLDLPGTAVSPAPDSGIPDTETAD